MSDHEEGRVILRLFKRKISPPKPHLFPLVSEVTRLESVIAW